MKLLPELVPKTAWGANLRSALPPGEWDRLRKESYRKAGYRCEVCGGKGKQHPVECHEVWEYDERKGVQRLLRLISLCPACHEVKHIGLAEMNGRLEEAMTHMRKVNGCSAKEADLALQKAWNDWAWRNGMEWKLELSVMGEKQKEEAGLKARWRKIGR